MFELRELDDIPWQCCDHPYIVDEKTPILLSKGLQVSEYLGFGIKASGKFQFLDAILMELKKQGLRALILYQVHHYLGIFPSGVCHNGPIEVL